MGAGLSAGRANKASIAAALIGRAAIRRGEARWRITGMGGSYTLLLTAFCVDNGPNLPVWRGGSRRALQLIVDVGHG